MGRLVNGVIGSPHHEYGQQALCGKCQHRYGRHTWGVKGPCAVGRRVGEDECHCDGFEPAEPDSESEDW